MMKVPPPPPNFPQPVSNWVAFKPLQNLDAPQQKQLREHQLQQAQEFLSCHETHRIVRERVLARLLETHHRDRIVLVMTLNEGHADLFANWAASCDAHSLEVRSWAVVFALDPGAAARVEALGFAVYYDGVSYGKQSTSAAKSYGDQIFARLMLAKTMVVQDILRLGYHPLFQDIDVIWRKDPLEFLRHSVRESLDAQFMYDGHNWIYQPLHVNTGFFLLRNAAPARQFWRLVCDNLDKVLAYRSQQVVVNTLLVSRYFRGLRLDVLPEKQFANGHLFSIESVEELPPDPYVVHCSWTHNLEHKVQKLRFANLWYLDGGIRRSWSSPTIESLDNDIDQQQLDPERSSASIWTPRSTAGSHLVMQVCISDEPPSSLYRLSIERATLYAARVGAEYHLVTQGFPGYRPHFAKLKAYQMNYAKIFYVDCDAIIMDECPDIFEFDEFSAAADCSGHSGYTAETYNNPRKQQFDMPLEHIYFNSGVMLFTQEFLDRTVDKIQQHLPEHIHATSQFDQLLLNQVVSKHYGPYRILNPDWNDWYSPRQSKYIQHYSGYTRNQFDEEDVRHHLRGS